MKEQLEQFLDLKQKKVSENYNLSDHPVDIMSFDKIFVECDIAQGMTIN